MTQLLSQTLNGLALGMVLFLVAGGLTIIFGLLRVINLAHGSFYLVGAYVGLTVQRSFGNYLVALLVAPLAVAALAFVVDLVLRRGLYGQPVNQVLATLGVAFIVGDLILWGYGGDPQTIGGPAFLSGAVELGPVFYPKYRLAIIVFGLVFATVLGTIWKRTRVGALLRAGVDDAPMLESLGVPVSRVFTSTFVVGSMIAAAAGVLGGPLLGAYIGLDFDVLLWSVVIVVVGGLGSPLGAFLGAIAIGLVDSYSKAYMPHLSYFAVFGPVVLILAFRPTGLIRSGPEQ